MDAAFKAALTEFSYRYPGTPLNEELKRELFKAVLDHAIPGDNEIQTLAKFAVRKVGAAKG